jgi:hypothetical protein
VFGSDLGSPTQRYRLDVAGFPGISVSGALSTPAADRRDMTLIDGSKHPLAPCLVVCSPPLTARRWAPTVSLAPNHPTYAGTVAHARRINPLPTNQVVVVNIGNRRRMSQPVEHVTPTIEAEAQHPIPSR